MKTNDEAATWDDMDWGDVAADVAAPKGASFAGAEEPALNRPAWPPAPAKTPPEPVPGWAAVPKTPRSQNAEAPLAADRAKANATVHTPATAATLTLTAANGSETVVAVERNLTVGRNPDNDLVIQDRQVSGHHARLAFLPNGSCEVQDLGSSGGTYVNGVQITTRILTNGDALEFAGVAARFHYIAGGNFTTEDQFGATLPYAKGGKPGTPMPQHPAPAKQAGMLVMLLPDGGKNLMPISRGEVAIGRDSSNDLVLTDLHVSARHAKIVSTEDGKCELIDLGSTCGTSVNGHSVKRHVLTVGDRVRFGVVECVFEVRFV